MNRVRNSRGSWTSRTVPLLATSAVLIALMGDRAFLRISPAQAEAYHRSVRAAASEMPLVMGSWLGIDVPVPPAAVKMLQPNIILARRYHNITSGERVTLLLVHVKDARDLLGHYPPVCYPAQGWKIESAEPTDWLLATREVQGTDYEFTADQGIRQKAVSNFFIARGGITCRDMDGVELAAQDRRRKFFGVAQVQFVYEGRNVSPPRRRQIVEQFITFMEPALSAISDRGAGEISTHTRSGRDGASAERGAAVEAGSE